MPADIESPANRRVKDLVALRRRRTRDQLGLALVEGHDELRLALDSGARPTQLYACLELIADDHLRLLDRLRTLGTPVLTMSRAAFERASYREGPDGFLAVAPDPSRRLRDLELPADPLLLVAEGIEKPGNLGAMLRSAEAAGADAVVAASPVTDWANPNVVRASKGTLFAVPVAHAPSADVIAWLRERRVSVVVATPEVDETLHVADLTGPTAIVVGAEHEGVTDAMKQAADRLVRLPMAGRVNSLNVATAAALCLFEALRQRSA